MSRFAAALLILPFLMAGCTEEPAVQPDCDKLIQDANGSDSKHTKIQVDSTKGTFKIELFDDATPITAKNFRTYAETGYYDHVVLHRIVKGFMAQGGKFDNTTKTAKVDKEAPIKNEALSSGCRNEKYTLSMARTNDPDSATTEFFVNFRYNDFLDADPDTGNPGYAVFGIVYEGQAVVDAIEQVPVHVYNPAKDPMCQSESGGKANCPDQPVEMISVKVIQ